MAGLASLHCSSSWTYDVFLSFAGKETRYDFSSNLCKALKERGIHTFFDDQELKGGEVIPPTLAKAIEESRIAIPVFSLSYADSSFCLDELANIMECVWAKGRLVYPVFHLIDPSVVRYQIGRYKDAIDKHRQRFDDDIVQKWIRALNQAANLSGKHFKGDVYQHVFIKEIVDMVSTKVNHVPLPVADHPVGLMSRVDAVCHILDLKQVFDRVRMIGIYGIGGIGKTTLVRAVYNSIADQFEGLCFLENVRENKARHGLEHLQEILLSDVLGERGIKLGSISAGIQKINDRFRRKKVLLILDDVNERDQLQALAGGPHWFGDGSRVIITTQDKGLLDRHWVKETYEVDGLNQEDAVELFKWNAFNGGIVDPRFDDEIINRAVAYAACHPLALEILGSYLFGVKSIKDWNSILDQDDRIPGNEIQRVFKTSFDALGEDELSIFLDIACCLNGFNLTEVEEILHAHHDFCPKHALRVLIDRSLIKIHLRIVTVQDLIQKLGREIVRKQGEPHQRSRLWFSRDIIEVLEDKKGTPKIEMIVLDLCKEKVVKWDGMAFQDMTNLKTLIIRDACFFQGPKHLPKSLRVLEWWNYPSRFLPAGFDPKKLAMFKLPYSYLTSLNLLGMLHKFENMRALILDDSKYMTRIPDLSCVPNLEELSFSKCVSLLRIHESVGFLGKLKILNAKGCSRLRSFPPLKLTSLEDLCLSSCSSLESFPEILEKMENITYLSLEYTAIKEFPLSIRNLTCLRHLYLNECEKPKFSSIITHFPESKVLTFFGSSIQNQGKGKASSMASSNKSTLHGSQYTVSDKIFPVVLALFANVEVLDLVHHSFTALPKCITECIHLRKLHLDQCHNLQEIRSIPPNLETLSAAFCRSLEIVDFITLPAAAAGGTRGYHALRTVLLDSCTSLREISGIPPKLNTLFVTHCSSFEILDLSVFPARSRVCRSLRRLCLDHCQNLQEILGVIPPNIEFSASYCTSLSYSCRNMLLNQDLHQNGGSMWLLFPESGIPDWFQHHSNGSSISFWFRNAFPAISLCVAFEELVGRSCFSFEFCPKLNINGNSVNNWLVTNKGYWHMPHLIDNHLFVFDDKQSRTKFRNHVNERLTWNHAEVSIDVFSTSRQSTLAMKIGIHVFSSMKDVWFPVPTQTSNNSTVEVMWVQPAWSGPPIRHRNVKLG